MNFQWRRLTLSIAGLSALFSADTGAEARDEVLVRKEFPTISEDVQDFLVIYGEENTDKLRIERFYFYPASSQVSHNYIFRTPKNVCDLIPGQKFDFDLKTKRSYLDKTTKLYNSAFIEICPEDLDPITAVLEFVGGRQAHPDNLQGNYRSYKVTIKVL